MKKIILSCLFALMASISIHAKKYRPHDSCALERGEQADKCIKNLDNPWYYGMPKNWAAPGQWFAGPMNRKYYGGYNAFPGPGRWVGSQW